MYSRKGRPDRGDDAWGGVRAPLEGCKRDSRKGFVKYWSQREWHYRDVYGRAWNTGELVRVLGVSNLVEKQ